MNFETILAFTAVASIAIISPGPAILLAMRNGVTLGMRAVICSSLGNVSGIFCLSAAAMLGLGVLLNSSAILFGVVKVLGALYLFYMGVRHLFGRASALNSPDGQSSSSVVDPEKFIFTPTPNALRRTWTIWR